ncbi:TlpA disulfide reductase family protein [Niabella yanshanensis]|uniref:TlpA disulfide reductase family protein n=1 Tax=Niabella yanshanensis TaxID=577386 RepID=A0ABZ0WDG9_9BACT|nr:TlpA disulfide reductase family protein [Niabella yanshanensis]WQD40720.1 TlpA disulfide reductase family protein [Niabella yanshanensis]
MLQTFSSIRKSIIEAKYFWLAAILIAVVPLLAMDIIQHYLDWQKEVREELIAVVQNLYSFDRQKKASILDKVFERNQMLMFLFYVKSFSIILLLILGFYFFKRYWREKKPKLWKPLFYTITLVACFTLTKIFIVNRINTNENVRFLKLDPSISSLQTLYKDNFNGKVVYVDFWGTTCGPCLREFRDFTKPLKAKYRGRDDIEYLYVSQGNEYLWQEQIRKYDIEGNHVFVSETQYEKLYRQTTKDSAVVMPHYLIIDKNGNIVEPDAKRPSDRDSLYVELDKYLAENLKI